MPTIIRTLKTFALGFTLIAVFTVGQKAVHADQIVAFTPTNLFQPNAFPGVSLSTPVGPAYNNITFNFLFLGGHPIAGGTLFILTQPYTGTPAGLSSQTAGFLAQSQSISAGQYIFTPSLTLQPNTTYFFYNNTAFPYVGASPPQGIIGYSAFGAGAFATGSSALPFAPNFVLSGTPVEAVPEPATLVLMATGLAGALGSRRVRRRFTKN